MLNQIDWIVNILLFGMVFIILGHLAWEIWKANQTIRAAPGPQVRRVSFIAISDTRKQKYLQEFLGKQTVPSEGYADE